MCGGERDLELPQGGQDGQAPAARTVGPVRGELSPASAVGLLCHCSEDAKAAEAAQVKAPSLSIDASQAGPTAGAPEHCPATPLGAPFRKRCIDLRASPARRFAEAQYRVAPTRLTTPVRLHVAHPRVIRGAVVGDCGREAIVGCPTEQDRVLGRKVSRADRAVSSLARRPKQGLRLSWCSAGAHSGEAHGCYETERNQLQGLLSVYRITRLPLAARNRTLHGPAPMRFRL